MRLRTTIPVLAFAALALGGTPGSATAQGQGKGQAKAQDRGRAEEAPRGQQGTPPGQRTAQGQARGQQGTPSGKQATPPGQQRAGQVQAEPPGRAAPGRAAPAGPPAHARARFTRAVTAGEMPPAFRQFATSNRRPQVVAAGAVARAHARGVRDDLRIVPAGDVVRVTNRRGDVLVLLDEDRARNLGRWRVDVLDRPPQAGAPSFCRSGEGHPVWGRQWCVQKGFGLGSFRDFGWGRTTTVGDVILRRQGTAERLGTAALMAVLGNTTFNRLALHAVTLGFTEPLTGRWAAEPTGERILLVDSGGMPVAELVDVNRNERADVLVVALRPW